MDAIENSPIPQPTQPVQPIPVESKKKSNLPVIIILLIAILLVGVGGVYAGMQISKNQIPVPLVSQPTVIPTTFVQPTIIPASDPTTNWKTYKNEEFGFEFKSPYPVDTLITKRTGFEFDILLNLAFGKDSNGANDFILTVFENENKLDLKSFYTKMINSRELAEGDIFDEKLATSKKQMGEGRVIYYFKDHESMRSLCDVYVWLEKDKIYEFRYFKDDYQTEIPQNKLIFDQILSTFKFTE